MDHYSRFLLENIAQMYENNVLTDVTLQVNDVTIDCHRNILAAASPYFRAMFVNPVKERDQRVIEMHNIESYVLKTVIGYIYTGSIKLTNENVQDFLMTATMLEISHLTESCASYMMKEVCIENCLEMFKFASHFVCNDLKLYAKKFILENFSDLMNDDHLFDLDVEDFEEIIDSDDIAVSREETIFEAIQRWTSIDDSRRRLFSRLFKHVRLPLIDPDYFQHSIEENQELREDPQCDKVLSMFKLYKRDISTNASESGLAYYGIKGKSRFGMLNRNLLVFSGGTVEKDSRSLTAFDPVTLKNYVGVSPHPTFDFKYKIDFYQLVSLSDNSLYFLGGIYYDDHHFEDAGNALTDVYVYDPKSVAWQPMSPMISPRCCFSTCVVGKTIFVIGGKSKYPRGAPLEAVEMYDTQNDCWHTVSPIPIGIYNHASAAVNDAIFVFGGKDEDDDFLDTVFRYDIPRDFWTLVETQMNKPRAQLCAFPYKTNIYLVGGSTLHENILLVEIYNPSENKWSFAQTFPEERKITSACLNDGKIYVCGGLRHHGVSGRRSRMIESRDLFRYDIEKKNWTKIVKLVQYANIHAVTCSVLNTKYLDESGYISSL